MLIKIDDVTHFMWLQLSKTSTQTCCQRLDCKSSTLALEAPSSPRDSWIPMIFQLYITPLIPHNPSIFPIFSIHMSIGNEVKCVVQSLKDDPSQWDDYQPSNFRHVLCRHVSPDFMCEKWRVWSHCDIRVNLSMILIDVVFFLAIGGGMFHSLLRDTFFQFFVECSSLALIFYILYNDRFKHSCQSSNCLNSEWISARRECFLKGSMQGRGMKEYANHLKGCHTENQ